MYDFDAAADQLCNKIGGFADRSGTAGRQIINFGPPGRVPGCCQKASSRISDKIEISYRPRVTEFNTTAL